MNIVTGPRRRVGGEEERSISTGGGTLAPSRIEIDGPTQPATMLRRSRSMFMTDPGQAPGFFTQPWKSMGFDLRSGWSAWTLSVPRKNRAVRVSSAVTLIL